MKEPNPKFKAVDPETGETVDQSVLDETGTAYDPARMTLDLNKDEKRRTTALMLAIQGYSELIIKDAAYLREMHDEARRNTEAPKLRAATIDAMVEAAWKFDLFIAGKLQGQSTEATSGGTQTEAAANPPHDPPDPLIKE